MFKQVISDYETLEPPGYDTWNPVSSDVEMWHRIQLFKAFKDALALISQEITKLRVLDIGCGNGRSTRMLVEFGIRPENILGVDLRPGAIEYAKKQNPAISFETVPNLNDWEYSNSFDLCMQATVFSSIKDQENRKLLADRMVKTIKPNGYIFWWDRIMSNTFAGGDLLMPTDYFNGSNLIFESSVSLRPTVAEALKRPRKGRGIISRVLQSLWGYPPTHVAALFKFD